MRYRMDLCYSGEGFCGWQRQTDAPSVQAEIEKALRTLLKRETAVTGAGRTDTGVNASAYVAHFDSPGPLDTGQLVHSLNAILPRTVAIRSIERTEDDFHARFNAVRREYKYFIHRRKDPFADAGSLLYAYPDLDFEKMNRAAGALAGTHDFSCFEKSGGDNKTSVCTVFEAVWSKTDEDHWVFTIAADRFLRNMVRAIVGTLLEVGRGRRDPDDIKELLECKNRCRAGESVPGHALFLTEVRY